MNAKIINDQAGSIRKPSRKDFWDHDDGDFQRTSLPGIMVWRSSDGEIALKSDINEEIAGGKYCSITAILVPENAKPIVIPQTPHKITLVPQISYTLLLLVVSITGNRVNIQDDFIEFYPEE